MMSKAGKKRAQKRLRAIENFNLQVVRLIDGLFLPVESPTQKEFDMLWEVTIASLFDLVDGYETNFRLVFNQATKALKALIKEKQWDIYFEVRLNTTQKEPVLRNSEWLENGFTLLNLHRQWFEDIKVNGLPIEPKDAFAAFFISLSVHSGICHRRYLWLIAEDLLEDKTRVRLFNGLPYINISFLPERDHYTNDYNESGEKIFTRKAFLSPISLHLLNHFLAIRTDNSKMLEKKQKHMIGLQGLMSKYWQKIGKQLYANSGEIGMNFSFPNAERLQQARGDNFSYYIKRLYFHQSVIKTAIFVLENTGGRLPQPLVHYAMGTLSSSCLPEAFYENFPLNALQPCSFIDFISVTVDNRSDKEYVHNNPHFFQKLKDALRQDPYRKTSSKVLQERLFDVQSQAQSLSERWLVEWFISLLNKNRASSIRTYHSRVSRRWLNATASENLVLYTAEDFESLYQRIDSNIDKGNDYTLQRFIQLHKFGVKRYAIPKINENIRQDTKAEVHIRSGFVTESLFSALLDAILQMTDTNDQTKKLLQAILIICYRCGLRISEVVKLRNSDLVRTNNGYWIYIRSNQFKDNKTYHSYRKLPMSAMLLPNEHSIVDLFTEHKKSSSTYLFAISNHPIDTQLISRIASYYLRAISGNSHLVLHHLRHSCISRLQLLMQGETCKSLPDFVPYEKEQAKKILSLIVAKNEYTEYALAKFAGHGDPEVTYKHYYHFTSYALGKVATESAMPIDKTLANQLLGIGRRKFSRLSHDNKTILLRDALPLFIKQCPILVKPKRAKQSRSSLTTSKSAEKVSNPARTYDIHLVNELLTKYAEKAPDLSSLLILYDLDRQFEQWLFRAQFIKEHYKTPQGKSRLFPKKRANQLAPAPLIFQADITYCDKLILKLRPYWKKLSREKRNQLLQCVDYSLSNTSASKSGVRFTDAKQLREYLKILKPLIPLTHWQAELSRVAGSNQEKAWRSTLKNIHCLEKSISSRSGRSGNGEVHLKLIPLSRDNMTSKNTRERASNLLVYLFHMMAIMMGEKVVLANQARK